jgi:hypothetical protein
MKRKIVIIQLLMLVLALPMQAQNKNFRKDFDDFKNKAKKEYSDFRKKALAEYAQFVREAWEEFGAEPPVQIPEEGESRADGCAWLRGRNRIVVQ